jgi:hypothetical protein
MVMNEVNFEDIPPGVFTRVLRKYAESLIN